MLIVGLLAGLALAVSGMDRLRTQSDDAASLRSRLLALTLAERLRRTSEEDRAVVLERAARRSGAELLLVSAAGQVIIDATQGRRTKRTSWSSWWTARARPRPSSGVRASSRPRFRAPAST